MLMNEVNIITRVDRCNIIAFRVYDGFQIVLEVGRNLLSMKRKILSYILKDPAIHLLKDQSKGSSERRLQWDRIHELGKGEGWKYSLDRLERLFVIVNY